MHQNRFRYTGPKQGEHRVLDGPPQGDKESIWTRLRRRKVVQWGFTYAAAAWGFLQGLAYVSTLFDWPAQLQKLTGLVLLIGLPGVLVVAWYHGDRGEQRVSRTELAILTLLFLFGGGLFWRYQHSTGSSPSAAATVTSATAPAAARPADSGPSIAVLPFDNRSAKADDEFFVDGIHDDILTQLSKISALKVISRTSVEQFRDTRLPIRDIAAQLGVTSILEGGVQRGGDRVRVTVQLIDAGTDGHLWAETYDRELTAENIFAIQSEVAAAIAGALKAELTAGEQTRVDAVPTQSIAAWESYQLGKQRMARRSSETLAEAEQFFHGAVELDPQFALAHVGLADVLALQIAYSGAPSAATLAQAEQSVAEALRLQPDLSEAWASSGELASYKGANADAESRFRRAIAINPNNATARHWYSNLLGDTGRWDESLEQIERAVALDPLSSVIRNALGGALERQGRFQDAEVAYRRAVTIDPLRPSSYESMATLIGYALGNPADAAPLARKAMQLDPGSPNFVVVLAMLGEDLGDVREAMQLTEGALRRWPDSGPIHSLAAALHAGGGDWTAASQSARKALAIDPLDGFALYLLTMADLTIGDAGAARARYAKAYPDLLGPGPPRIDGSNYFDALGLAIILLRTGDDARARQLLDGSERAIRQMPRLGVFGYGITDAQIHALRGDKARALAALREAGNSGWRGPFWRFFRDVDPALASIRNELEFQAVFADIERDMARQRAELAKRPKDAPLDLGPPN
jgi:TolB-like protein/cytochrome c-type biogenesis protein CcmH/NrfG